MAKTKTAKEPKMSGVKITQVVSYCATKDGVQACASSEKKAVALLEKTLKERDK